MVQALFQRPRTRRDPLAVSFQRIRSLQRIRSVDPCMDQERLALRHGLRGVDGMDAQVPSRIPVQHAVVDGNIAQRRLPCRVQGIASCPLSVAQHEKPGWYAVGNEARAQLQRISQPGLVAAQIQRKPVEGPAVRLLLNRRPSAKRDHRELLPRRHFLLQPPDRFHLEIGGVFGKRCTAVGQYHDHAARSRQAHV